MDKDALRAWLRLSMTDGVGNEAARRLLACFGSPQTVFEQTHTALCQVVSTKQAQALLTEPNALACNACAPSIGWLISPTPTATHCGRWVTRATRLSCCSCLTRR